jgi:predicted ATPase
MNSTTNQFRPQTVHVSGFKSLHDFKICFERPTALIGSNGAGKSNLIESLDLLTSVYRSGIDEAIDQAGGFDVIARRTAAGIEDRLSMAISGDITMSQGEKYRLQHSFTIRFEGRLGQFSVNEEHLSVSDTTGLIKFLSVDRTHSGFTTMYTPEDDSHATPAILEAGALFEDFKPSSRYVEKSKLVFPAIAPFSVLFSSFTDKLGSTREFEIDATLARQDSDKSHRPELSVYGESLPSFLEWLESEHPDNFARVETGFREILPGLRSLNVAETHPGVRAVRFDMESGVTPLFPDSVSDGTIKYLVLLAALEDPRSSILLLEEPENGLHPWLINRLSEAIISASFDKTIVMTTHSPQFIRSLPRKSIVVMWNEEFTTNAAGLDSLAPELVEAWSSGELDVLESIESGAIAEYLPSYQ